MRRLILKTLLNAELKPPKPFRNIRDLDLAGNRF